MSSITYDSINKILTVSSVSSNNIFEDVYQTDVANGWNVFKKVCEKVYYYEDILLEIKNSTISAEGDTLTIKNTSSTALTLRFYISGGSFEFKRCTFNFININNEGKAQFYPSGASLFKNCVFNCPLQRNGSYETNSSGINGTVFEECYIDMYFPTTNAKFKNTVFAGNYGFIVNPQNGQIYDNISFYRPFGWCFYIPQIEFTINKGTIDAQYFALMRDTEKLKMLDVNLIKKDFQYFYDDGYEGDLEIVYTVDFKIYDENENEITKNIKIYDKDNNIVYDGVNQRVELFEYTYHIIGDGTIHNVDESDLTKYLPYKFEVYDELQTYYEGYITELTPNKLIEISIITPERNIFNDIDELKAEIQTHRNAVEPNIDTNISSRASQESVNAIPTNPLLDNDARLDNLDVSISSRSSHTPEDVWTYSNRELSNPDNYKADTSSLAKEATLQVVKNQTDKLQFSTTNDVKATLDGEAVLLNDETETQIDEIDIVVNQIQTKTNNLPNDPASNTDINNAKNNILSEIQLNRDLINELLDIEEGNWEITNNQMVFYKRDGAELLRFNLFDDDGNPTETKVYKRVKI